MTIPRRLMMTGFPGWFGSRFIEMMCGDEFHAIAAHPFDEIIALVEPERVAHARTLLESFSQSGGNVVNVQIISCDLSDAGAWEALDLPTQDSMLLHAAGIIHPRRVQDFERVNVQGSKHVLAYAATHGAQNAVVISSNSPCGCNPNAGHRLTSSSPFNPYMGYGRSKMKMEMIANAWSASTAIPLTILRPCWFFGPHQPERQARFFQLVSKGVFPLFGGGKNLRSITFVDDLVQAAFRALMKHATGARTYWIALEQAASMREIVDTTREVMMTDFGLTPSSRSIPLPSVFADMATLADAGLQRLRVYHQEMHVLGEMNKHIACSIQDAKTELGFEPLPSLREAIYRSIAWARMHGQQIS